MTTSSNPASPEASQNPRAADLTLSGHTFGPDRVVIMAVINRTVDSFYPSARFDSTRAAVDAAMAALDGGADLVDIGGVRAGDGPDVSVAEEIRRVIPVVEAVKRRIPTALISVDTWRSPVAQAAIDAGAALINDTWAGHDPNLVHVAGAAKVGLVCSHTGGLTPRTQAQLPAYGTAKIASPYEPAGVVTEVLDHLRRAADVAVAAGVPRASVIVDPTPDFGKNTWQSLQLVRATAHLAGLGFPLLMALSRKDFVGEALGAPVDQRLYGTLAATAYAAERGAKIFRAHDVVATRQVVDMVSIIRGELAPFVVSRSMELKDAPPQPGTVVHGLAE